MHYRRWTRQGDPLIRGSTAPGDCLRFLIAALRSSADDCIEWPYSGQKAYPQINFNGHNHRVNRLVCAVAHGLPLAPDLDAAHSCDNPPCINPRHLRWATHRENLLDKHR
jgi:hypothetical protein